MINVKNSGNKEDIFSSFADWERKVNKRFLTPTFLTHPPSFQGDKEHKKYSVRSWRPAKTKPRERGELDIREASVKMGWIRGT